MKKLLPILFILLSFNVYAACDDVNCMCATKECRADRDIIRKNFYCGGEDTPSYKSLWMSGKSEGERVFYIFRLFEGTIKQVGIIDEAAYKIFHVENLKKVNSFSWCIKEDNEVICDEDRKKSYLDDNFPDISPLNFYRKQPGVLIISKIPGFFSKSF